jgi:hypothetical protein
MVGKTIQFLKSDKNKARKQKCSCQVVSSAFSPEKAICGVDTEFDKLSRMGIILELLPINYSPVTMHREPLLSIYLYQNI